ncbi:hypothetical protein CCH79_00005940 [Gambusia affinis]|uniref:Catenin alpha-2 n=1 Tax=Gambusia affinis TaxID=33528 RepID=A0A315VKD9_GAMAF|nr:hypothetical protein CCH79_00005940 [Gambusia affinis]
MAGRDLASDAGSDSAEPLQSCERSPHPLAETQREKKKQSGESGIHSLLQSGGSLASIITAAGRKDKSDALNTAIDRMTKKTRDLRRQLRKAVMDHVSDSFLETNVPLLVLIEAAKNGNEKEVKEYAQVFREHANKLIEVANLACSISNNEEGVKLVRMAASQLEALCPQVINAALALAAKPNSKVAQDNMDVFKDQWEKQVRVLTDAVDDITSIDDFLSVSENHILEDVNKCVIALQEKDVDGLDRTAGAIRGRAARVVHVVTSEMDNYEPGVYTEKVLEATKLLTNSVMPRFTEQVESAVEALSAGSQPVDENEFIDASRLVYDGIRDIRKAVLMIRTPEELDDSDFETEDFDNRSKTSVQTEDDQLIAGQSARAIMARLPQEQKAKIAEQVASFQEEKSKLDAEVSKWDDSGNDIIVLAKQMCMIMMEMTDFTRGKGPLKNTSDVIKAAKKIAEAGTKMDKLGRSIADLVSENELIKARGDVSYTFVQPIPVNSCSKIYSVWTILFLKGMHVLLGIVIFFHFILLSRLLNMFCSEIVVFEAFFKLFL